jgi:hypothetical protein
MNTLLNSWQELEAFLRELEPELPADVHLLGPFVGNASRICSCFGNDGPSRNSANPFAAAPTSAWSPRPFVVSVDLYLAIKEGRGWIYSVNFVVDDLVSSDEVRAKVHSASSILLAYQESETNPASMECSVSGPVQHSIKRKPN